jgi:hypothetical protein
MKHGCLLIILFLFTQLVKADPAYPACFNTEAKLKAWIEKTITDAPPPGYTVVMMHHLTPHYANNNKVGEIWVVSAVVKVTSDADGSIDHEMCFCVFHADTLESELKVAFKIPENKLQEYLNIKPDPTPIGDKQI